MLLVTRQQTASSHATLSFAAERWAMRVPIVDQLARTYTEPSLTTCWP